MTESKRRRTHIARRGRKHGSNSQGLPRRADAISRAGVRELDTGRVVRHGGERQRRPALTIASTIHATLRRTLASQRIAIVGNPRLVGAARASSGRSLLAHCDRQHRRPFRRVRSAPAYAPPPLRPTERRALLLARSRYEAQCESRPALVFARAQEFRGFREYLGQSRHRPVFGDRAAARLVM